MNEVDLKYQRAMDFAKNYQANHHALGMSNVYVLQTVDEAGNVTGEYYGMNAFTDYGMTTYFNSGNPSFATNVYIGNGVGTITVASNALFAAVTSNPATVSNSTKNYAYPLYYARETGLITCTCQFLVAYFDYNVNSSPWTISEYGIGTGINALWTHSWVYDNLGRTVTITKLPNERLYITVYMCLSYNEQLINDAWTQHKHIVITTMQRFFDHMDVNTSSGVKTFKRYNATYNRASTRTRSSFDQTNHAFTNYQNLTEFTFSTGTTDEVGYMDGIAEYTTGFLMLERETNPTAENISTVLSPYTSKITENDAFAYNFGDKNRQPFTQVDISKSYTFDHLTGQYDSEETFTQTANKWYTETPMSTAFAMPIYHTTNNTVQTMYVYQNLQTDDPILAIRGNHTTVYATDKYWDTTAWTFISNLTDIPVSERNRKYWISGSNVDNLDPLRGNPPYKVGPEDGRVLGFTQSFNSGIRDACASKNGNYFVIDNYVFDMTRLSRVTIDSTTGLAYTRSYVMDDNDVKIIYTIHSNGTQYVVTTYDSVLQQWNTTNQTTPSSGLVTNLWNCYMTHNIAPTSGDACLCSIGTSGVAGDDNIFEMVIGDGTTSYFKKNCVTGCVVHGTENHIALIMSATDHVIDYYSDLSSSPIKQFTIPSGAATPKWICGYEKWLYVTDGATYMYVIDTVNETVNACDAYIPWNSNFYKIRFTATDDCMIAYRYDDTHMQYGYLMRADNPTHIVTMSAMDSGVSSKSTGCSYELYKHNGTDILLYQIGYSSNYSTIPYVFDFSHWMYDGTIQKITLDTSSTRCVLIGSLLGRQNTLSKIVNYIPHKITGTTNTITAINNIKNIRGKQWSITYTNTPSFNGLPPGVLQ